MAGPGQSPDGLSYLGKGLVAVGIAGLYAGTALASWCSVAMGTRCSENPLLGPGAGEAAAGAALLVVGLVQVGRAGLPQFLTAVGKGVTVLGVVLVGYGIEMSAWCVPTPDVSGCIAHPLLAFGSSTVTVGALSVVAGGVLMLSFRSHGSQGWVPDGPSDWTHDCRFCGSRLAEGAPACTVCGRAVGLRPARQSVP